VAAAFYERKDLDNRQDSSGKGDGDNNVKAAREIALAKDPIHFRQLPDSFAIL
jgi:hypothetical protein